MTSNTAVGAELGIYPLKTGATREKVEMAIYSKGPKERSPTHTQHDGALQEKCQKASWNEVGQRRESMKGYRRKPGRGSVRREVREIQDRSKRKDGAKGQASANI